MKKKIKNLKAASRLIRSGYHKYSRTGILKFKTIRNLIEVLSFERTMNLLTTLNQDSLSKVAHYFGINEFNDSLILLEQLNYIKDIRNYLSHNFKVLGIRFNQKSTNYYEQQLEATNDHHYLHLILTRFSSKNQLLLDFITEYQSLFANYQIKINGEL